MSVAVRVHVAPRGNAFMRDIAGWLVDAARATGRVASLELERLPEADGDLHLAVAPHELFPLSGVDDASVRRALGASVIIGTEQPGTPWFETTVAAAGSAAAVLDINVLAVTELRRRGIEARHLQLGAVPSIDATGGDRAERPIDVLFLGALDDRRSGALARLAAPLAQRRVELRLFRFDAPVGPHTPGLVFGQDKYALLSRSKVLLNIHRHTSAGPGWPAYFEWARMVEAMANGCVVVTEPSFGTAPLVPGVHLVEAELDDLAGVLASLLDDAPRRELIAAAAHEVVLGDLSLEHTLGPLLDDLEREAGAHPQAARTVRAARRPLFERPRATRRRSAFRPHLELHRDVKRAVVAEDRLLRHADRVGSVLRWGEPLHLARCRTPGWASARPEVSVVVPSYDQAHLVTDTLDSIAESADVTFELVVIDDHANDDSAEVVRRWMDHHPDVAATLVEKSANEGLGAARNTGFGEARAPYVMVIDADNLVMPTCLRRLADALHGDPTAGAAYSILADFGETTGLRSALDWDVPRLCRGNYLDAQAMWRRDTWQQLGGYRDDEGDVYGWEDWDLWLRLADAGGHATMVRQVLGRYRVQATSMVALSSIAQDFAVAAIKARYPGLPWPADDA